MHILHSSLRPGFKPPRTHLSQWTHHSSCSWLGADSAWRARLSLCISGELDVNRCWLNKLIIARSNEIVKWEVWDLAWVGEVIVALWGQSECSVAYCRNAGKEQWDITHPQNMVQRVSRVAWVCFCRSASLSVFESPIHARIKVAEFRKMGLDKVWVRECISLCLSISQ